MALQLLALPAIVARQAAPAGWPGFVGYVLTFFAWFLLTGFYLVDNLILSSWLAALAPHAYGQWSQNPAVVATIHVANALLAGGGALLGLATLRASVFARGAGVLLVAAAAASLGSYIYGNLTTVAVALVALGLGWMGYTLLPAHGAAATPAMPVTRRVREGPVSSPRALA
jgi:hypothetical protein